jgi:uncharacterized RDD family membrane protein YckC
MSEIASTDVSYAGFWRRFWAALLDGTLFCIACCTFFFFWKSVYSLAFSRPLSFDLTPPSYLLLFVESVLLGWLYCAAMESASAQATLGKMAMGVAVSDIEGNRLSFARATARHFTKWLSAGLLLGGFVMAGVTSRKQALHDLMTDCLVVRRENPNQTLFRVVGFGALLLVLCIRLAIAYQNELARQEQVKREEETRLQEAVAIARQSHALTSLRTADQVLVGWAPLLPGFQRIIGWKATAYGNGVYLVTYMATTTSGERGWAFEVSMPTRSVLLITGNPVLEGKYGFTPAVAPTPPPSKAIATPQTDAAAAAAAEIRGRRERAAARHMREDTDGFMRCDPGYRPSATGLDCDPV